MGVRNSRESTAGSAPQNIGLNYNATSYTMNETASDSVTLVMLRIPAGARIADVTLTIDNNALDATGGGQVSTQTRIGLADARLMTQTGSGSLITHRWNPTDEAHALRHSASANLVVQLQNFVNTGTAATVFTISVLYDCQKQGD